MLRLSAADIAEVYPGRIDFPLCGWGLMTDDYQLVMVGGLQWIDGRCYMWMDHVPRDGSKHVISVVRCGRHMLRRAAQLGEEEVWAIRDDVPTSQRLLSVVGFRYHGMEDDKELWVWHASPSKMRSPTIWRPAS